MSVRKLLLAATVLAIPMAANAQVVNGSYVGVGAGIAFISSNTLNIGQYSGSIAQTGVGASFEGSAGYGFGNGLRLELELLGLTANQKVNFAGVSGKPTNVTTGVMVNALYDFDLGLPVTPYIGAGVGYLGVQERSFHLNYGANTFTASNGTYGSFGVQGIAGLSLPLSDHFSATLEYRALEKTQSRNLGGTVSYGSNAVPGTVNIGSSLDQSILVGLRYALNVPAAAAPAPVPASVVAPAPAPARSYLVFFDWDSAALTARAQQILADAAKNSTAVQSTKIDVAGHADKSGTAAYNQTLSLKRANNVAAELVRLGVSKSAISITAYGDTKPLVPTAPGVREPQNRRVEIVLH